MHRKLETERSGNWWTRPCGGRDVVSIALPLVVQSAFWSIMWFVDRMFLMWYSPDAMAAALPAGMYHWTMICLPIGIASYVNTFVAQYYGAHRHDRIGLAVKQGIWFGWAMVPIFLLAIPLAPLIFPGSKPTPEIVRLEIIYFQVLALGAGPLVVSHAQSAFYTGRGLTVIVMLVNVAGTCVNAVLDYLLIFGHFGFPELGIAGAGLATALGNWFTVGVFWLLMRRKADRDRYGLGTHRFDLDLFRRLLRFGVPSGLPLLVEAGAFTLLIKYVSEISLVASAATSLAFNVNAVAFVPIIGLSIAVSTLVGQKLGENRPELAARATWTALVIGLAYTGLFGVLYIGLPDWFLVAHAAGADPEQFAKIHDTTVILLRFVALYCLFDATQIVFVGALKGAGDTRFILLASLVLSILAIAGGRLAQQQYEWNRSGFSLYGWWWVLTGWIFALSVVYLLRFVQGKWQAMRVIEPEIAEVE